MGESTEEEKTNREIARGGRWIRLTAAGWTDGDWSGAAGGGQRPGAGDGQRRETANRPTRATASAQIRQTPDYNEKWQWGKRALLRQNGSPRLVFGIIIGSLVG